MSQRNIKVAQLLLRLTLGLGFLLPVLDRLGWLGAAGENGNAWGNWENFVSYTHSLMPYLHEGAAAGLGFVATFLEAVFGLCLMLGVKIRWMALGSAFLTLAFALSMFFFSNYRAPFNASVFVVSAASFLLACLPSYDWELIK